MSRNSRRAVAIAIAGVFAVAPLVSACAAGSHPQSAMPTQLVEGVNASAHQRLRPQRLRARPGARPAARPPAPPRRSTRGSSTTRPSPDRLIAVEAAGVAQSAEIAGGGLDLPPGRLVKTVQCSGAQPTAGRPSPRRGHATPSRPQEPGAPSRRPLAPGRRPHPSASGNAAPGSATPRRPPRAAPRAPGVARNASVVVLKGLAHEPVRRRDRTADAPLPAGRAWSR